MLTQQGYINVYRSGFFHTAGKAGTVDTHGGDIYTTREKAIEDINPVSHYIATVPIEYPVLSLVREGDVGNPRCECHDREACVV
jgi:hypothetical protein